MRAQNLLSKITAAAARCVPFAKIGTEIGLTPNEWRELVDVNREAVALAVAQGRALAEIEIAKALQRASQAGSTDATLFILQRHFDWPKPKVGRPRKQAVQVSLLPQQFL